MKKEVKIAVGVSSAALIAVAGIGITMHYRSQASENTLSNSNPTEITPQAPALPVHNKSSLTVDKSQNEQSSEEFEEEDGKQNDTASSLKAGNKGQQTLQRQRLPEQRPERRVAKPETLQNQRLPEQRQERRVPKLEKSETPTNPIALQKREDGNGEQSRSSNETTEGEGSGPKPTDTPEPSTSSQTGNPSPSVFLQIISECEDGVGKKDLEKIIEMLKKELKITDLFCSMDLRHEVPMRIDDATSMEELKKLFQYNYLKFMLNLKTDGDEMFTNTSNYLRCLRREAELNLPKPALIYLFECCLFSASTIPIISLPAILIEYVPESVIVFEQYKSDLRKVAETVTKYIKSEISTKSVMGNQLLNSFDKVDSFCKLLDALKNTKKPAMAQELYDAADKKLSQMFPGKWEAILKSPDLNAAKTHMAFIPQMLKSKEHAKEAKTALRDFAYGAFELSKNASLPKAQKEMLLLKISLGQSLDKLVCTSKMMLGAESVSDAVFEKFQKIIERIFSEIEDEQIFQEALCRCDQKARPELSRPLRMYAFEMYPYFFFYNFILDGNQADKYLKLARYFERSKFFISTMSLSHITLPFDVKI